MSEEILNFRIEYHVNQEGALYVARTVGMELTAEGNTIQEAVDNLNAAVELYYMANDISTIPRLVAYDLENHIV